MALRLGVNIDHVATLRQARYRTMPDAFNAEPSVVQAALDCEAAGAHSITVHLRADRRHMQDRDVFELRESIATHLNFEMGNTPEILEIALRLTPDFVCMVPENREEVTTEGGLNVAAQKEGLKSSVDRLQSNGSMVSLFIDPDESQVRASAEIGAKMVELHTGAFANLPEAARAPEVERLRLAAELAQSLGLQVNAGHGLTTDNLPDLFSVPHLVELNIGHHLVSRSISVGLPAAIEEMLAIMAAYPETV